MKIEMYQLTWGAKDWYWRVTKGHVVAAGRSTDAVAAAKKLVNGISWVETVFLEPKTAESVFCFEPSAMKVEYGPNGVPYQQERCDSCNHVEWCRSITLYNQPKHYCEDCYENLDDGLKKEL